MPEPLKPVNTTVFGGVKVDANRVAKFSTVNQNGATRFVIDFKNGTKVEYPRQKQSNESQILIFDIGRPDIPTRMSIQNLANGKIKGGNDNDSIYLEGCNGSVVDVRGGGADKVDLSASLKFKSINNKVIQDDKDVTNLTVTESVNLFDPGHDLIPGERYEVKGEGTVSENDY